MKITWNRKLWGIEFRAVDGSRIMIGSLWSEFGRERAHYVGEPTRAQLFTNRKDARKWCADRHPKSELIRFRPVRVRETVRRVK